MNIPEILAIQNEVLNILAKNTNLSTSGERQRLELELRKFFENLLIEHSKKLEEI